MTQSIGVTERRYLVRYVGILPKGCSDLADHLRIHTKRRRQIIRCPTYYQMSRHCSLCNVMFGAKIYLITYLKGFVSILYRLQTIIISSYRDQE